MQSVRLALRALRASPVITVVAVASLAFGIGANTAIFSLVDSLILRALPVDHPERLAIVSTVSPDARQQYSYRTYEQIRQHTDTFVGAAAYTDCCGAAIVSVGSGTRAFDRQFVSGDFFTTLGVHAFRGRLLTPADDTPNPPDGPVAVVSYRLWRTHFAGREDIAGARLSINRLPVTVVGVMPPSFFGLEAGRVLDIAMPYRLAARFTNTPFGDDMPWLNILVRLKAGLSVSAGGVALRLAQAGIRTAAMPVSAPRQEFLSDALTLEPAARGASQLRLRFERPLLVLFLVVVLVLLAACANIGNLLLARGVSRRHELAVRMALGASRQRLVRQLLTESAVLAALGTSLGIAAAPVTSRLLIAPLSTARAPIALDATLDWRVLLFSMAVAVLATMIVGVTPALRASRIDSIEALLSQDRTSSARYGGMSGSFVIAQVVLSLVLLVTAGMFVQTFDHLLRVPLGFERDRTLVVEVSAPSVDVDDRTAVFERFARAAAALPGVVAAGGSMNPPLVGFLEGDLVVSTPGTVAPPNAEHISQLNTITPGWLTAYGTGLMSGRDFDDRDTLSSPPVMLVNDAFVRRFSAGADVVGSTLAVAMRIPSANDVPLGSRTIVGVVRDTVFRSIRERIGPTIYIPLSQWERPIPQDTFYIGVRSATAQTVALSGPIETALRRIDNDLTLRFEPLSSQIADSLAADRVLAVVSGVFGIVAAVLAVLGLYGVTAFAIARRRTEIGIRVAIGATPADIVTLTLRRMAFLIAAGILIGVGLSEWASTLVASLLYGLEPGDPTTVIVAALTVTTITAIASWLPAWRASRIDPAITLTHV